MRCLAWLLRTIKQRNQIIHRTTVDFDINIVISVRKTSAVHIKINNRQLLSQAPQNALQLFDYTASRRIIDLLLFLSAIQLKSSAKYGTKKSSETDPGLGPSLARRHFRFYDVATHMRRSSIFLTAHKSRFLHRLLKFWSWVGCSLLPSFFPVFNLLRPGKTALYRQMECYSSPGLVFLVLSAWISCCMAFYLPGLAPVSYCEPGTASNPACLVSIIFWVVFICISFIAPFHLVPIAL